MGIGDLFLWENRPKREAKCLGSSENIIIYLIN